MVAHLIIRQWRQWAACATITVSTPMLQLIRSQAGSFIVKALFGLLLISFSVWGIRDFLIQGPRDIVALKVGSETLSATGFQSKFREDFNRLKQRRPEITLEEVRAVGLVDQLVKRYTVESLLDQEAQHLNIRVGDQQIAEAIAQEQNFRDSRGKFNPAAFKAFLNNTGMTEATFTVRERQAVMRSTLASVAASGADAPTLLKETLYQVRNQKRIADWVVIPPTSIKDPPAPGPDEIKAFYQANLGRFMTPEYRTITGIVVGASDVDGEITIDEAKLKETFEQRQDEFVKPERRHVLQILATDQKTIEAAAAALAAGKDFIEVAKTIAKMDAAAVDLGTVLRADLPPAVADLAFAAKENEVSAPTQDLFGWRLVKVTGIEAGGVADFAAVRPQIENIVRLEAQTEKLYAIQAKIEDALSANVPVENIADQFKLRLYKLTDVDQAGRTTDGKQAEFSDKIPLQMLLTGFGLEANATSPIQTVQGETLIYLVRVDNIAKPQPKPLEKITDDVKSAFLNEARAKALSADAKAFVDAVKTPDGFVKEASLRKLKPQTTAAFTRTDPKNESKLPPELVSKLFTLKPGEVAEAQGEQGYVVAQLKEIKEVDPKAETVGVDKLNKQVSAEMGQEWIDAFTETLRKRYPVDVNKPVIDKITGGGDQ